MQYKGDCQAKFEVKQTINFPRNEHFSNIGVKNDDDYENNDKIEDIKNGLLDDFNDLILFGFSENPFKAPNLSIDRRLKTVFWFRPTVPSK